MYIKNLKLRDFRNYEVLELKFNKNVNLIIGNNAQGKTNILEALYLTAIGRSFRTSKEKEMIRFGSDISNIYIEAEKKNYPVTVDMTIAGNSKKEVKINDVKIKKTSQLLDNIYIVIFSPEDLKIVKDEPEKRRKFIDKELCQIKPSYYNSLVSYRKALDERNAYLKEIKVDPIMMDVWDSQLSEFGALIIHQRKIFIEKLSEISSEIHKKISNGKEVLKLEYNSNIEYVEDLKKQKEIFYSKLKESFDNDLRQRTTTNGPHKDDLSFYISIFDTDKNDYQYDESINVRKYGSQGQQRTAALSLKLAETDIIKKETGEDPVLLLDDVMSELDIERQEFLVKSLSDNQLFVTTTEIPEKVLQKFPEASLFKINKGNVE